MVESPIDALLATVVTHCGKRNCAYQVSNDPKVILDQYGFCDWSNTYGRFAATSHTFAMLTQYTTSQQEAVLSGFGFSSRR